MHSIRALNISILPSVRSAYSHLEIGLWSLEQSTGTRRASELPFARAVWVGLKFSWPPSGLVWIRTFKGRSRQVWPRWVKKQKKNTHTRVPLDVLKLGLGYVDLFLIHNPDLIKGKLESVWRTFEELCDTGLTKRVIQCSFQHLYWHPDRSIGVSNFNIRELEHLLKIARVKPVVNQIRFHPYNWAENKALLEFHQKHGIVTEAYSSLSCVEQ